MRSFAQESYYYQHVKILRMVLPECFVHEKHLAVKAISIVAGGSHSLPSTTRSMFLMRYKPEEVLRSSEKTFGFPFYLNIAAKFRKIIRNVTPKPARK